MASALNLLTSVNIKDKLNKVELAKPNPDDKLVTKSQAISASDLDSAQFVLFIGAEHGSGSSELAFNTALKLADINKVLYVNAEFISRIFFEYQLSLKDKQLKTLPDLADINDKVITYKELKQKFAKNDDLLFMRKNFDQFAPNLQYLDVTPEFQGEVAQLSNQDLNLIISKTGTKLATSYDYVIIDAEDSLHARFTQMLLNYCQQVVLTFTQNAAQINATGNLIEVMNRKLPQTKYYTVLNMYSSHVIKLINKDMIPQQIDAPIDLMIPNQYSAYQNAAYNGLPMVYYDQTDLTNKLLTQMTNLIA